MFLLNDFILSCYEAKKNYKFLWKTTDPKLLQQNFNHYLSDDVVNSFLVLGGEDEYGSIEGKPTLP